MSAMKVFTDPIIKNNPIAVQVLGICSTLAVTTKMEVTLVMAVSVMTVTALSNLFISMLRKLMPSSIRLIIEMTVVATLVIIADQIIKAYMFEVSKQLSVFMGLIITNCIIMGRAEAYAISNPPFRSFLDGLGNGAGYGLVLIIIATIREIVGSGKFFGMTVLPTVNSGGWYQPNGLFLLAPSAFFLIGILIWIARLTVVKAEE
ncbi:NADH:ubiquinone reductase (Na(+)-transporting) subunit D [Seleniivibrio woodruffii]|uniref:Na(+)-translocating NADH-quinone reductase subunit D n=1 Tax=Seleniivibrio woodruffii TaxID=1078050 RepID=A0A4R1KDN3_9BACT|nr:NADH:ubiquinone reductase (Na(+)-transporting) subunit D [Seleniivibrio woodruffii]TCK62664.1 Na+-transporting NADH:ubiquinone oxidoreductase subunit D [Seleniivibrio woodruffii]TVZ36910.1 Na+-transporting NADH:ubiquinone oxidoreductase subunit D [Seleniivibrio woodruffii]